MAATRNVPCPRCGQPALFARENPWRPFCSERCKMIDLGAWAAETYRLAGESGEPEKDDEGDA